MVQGAPLELFFAFESSVLARIVPDIFWLQRILVGVLWHNEILRLYSRIYAEFHHSRRATVSLLVLALAALACRRLNRPGPRRSYLHPSPFLMRVRRS